jgi:hypothetical protein
VLQLDIGRTRRLVISFRRPQILLREWGPFNNTRFSIWAPLEPNWSLGTHFDFVYGYENISHPHLLSYHTSFSMLFLVTQVSLPCTWTQESHSIETSIYAAMQPETKRNKSTNWISQTIYLCLRGHSRCSDPKQMTGEELHIKKLWMASERFYSSPLYPPQKESCLRSKWSLRVINYRDATALTSQGRLEAGERMYFTLKIFI